MLEFGVCCYDTEGKMSIRENLEKWEKEYLSPYASLSMNSKGREKKKDVSNNKLYSFLQSYKT